MIRHPIRWKTRPKHLQHNSFQRWYYILAIKIPGTSTDSSFNWLGICFTQVVFKGPIFFMAKLLKNKNSKSYFWATEYILQISRRLLFCTFYKLDVGYLKKSKVTFNLNKILVYIKTKYPILSLCWYPHLLEYINLMLVWCS